MYRGEFKFFVILYSQILCAQIVFIQHQKGLNPR